MRGPPLQPCLRFALFKWPLNKWWVIHRDPHAAAVVWTRRGGCVRSAASTLLPHSPHAARIHAAPTQPPLHNRAATTRPHATPANAATAQQPPAARRFSAAAASCLHAAPRAQAAHMQLPRRHCRICAGARRFRTALWSPQRRVWGSCCIG